MMNVDTKNFIRPSLFLSFIILVTGQLEPDLQLGLCLLPARDGTGTCLITRYYYDANNGACETFEYGACGHGSNEIHFNTMDKCKNDTAICKLPMDTGPCNESLPRFFWNQQNKSCESFLYSGCGGNTNNFETKEECEKTSDVCELPKDNGTCISLNWHDKHIYWVLFVNATGCGEKGIFDSGAECKDDFHICDEPVEADVLGAEVHLRYDEDDKSYLLFAYSGCQNYRNPFEAHRECAIACNY